MFFLLAGKFLLSGEESDSNRAAVTKTLTEAQLLSAIGAKHTEQEPFPYLMGVFLLAGKCLLSSEGSDSNRVAVTSALTEAQLLSAGGAKLTEQEPFPYLMIGRRGGLAEKM